MAHAGLRSQMNNSFEVAVAKKLFHAFALRQVKRDKPEPRPHAELPEPRVLKPGVVVVVQVIHPDDLYPIGKKPVHEMRADETGSAGDQDPSVLYFLHDFSLGERGSRLPCVRSGQLGGSVRSLSGEHNLRGARQDMKVQPWRPIANVITIQANTIA